MPAPASWAPFEYAVIRVIPRVDRGECVNAGVVLFSRSRRFLDARVGLNDTRLAALQALAPDLDLDLVRERLSSIQKVCDGGADGGPIGQLSQAERFHWLVAPASTIVQASPVHGGLSDDPEQTLSDLYERFVRTE